MTLAIAGTPSRVQLFYNLYATLTERHSQEREARQGRMDKLPHTSLLCR